MFKSLLSLFFIVFLISCSNLELKNIKCNNDSNKCPKNTICMVDECVLLCDNNDNCNTNEQCAFAINPITNSVDSVCIAIGTKSLYDHCSNTEPCQNKLSCLPNPENPNENICTSNDNLCTIDSYYLGSNTKTCNENKGVCYRESKNLAAYCLKDECNPTSLTNCPNEETCVFTGFIYQCIKYGSNGANVGEPCNTSKDCDEYLTCSDDKKCIHLCRPNNTYNYDDNCIGTCDDLKTILIFKNAPKVKNLDKGVIGICDYK